MSLKGREHLFTRKVLNWFLKLHREALHRRIGTLQNTIQLVHEEVSKQDKVVSFELVHLNELEKKADAVTLRANLDINSVIEELQLLPEEYV